MKSSKSNVIQRLLAEFVGTLILVFGGCLGCGGFDISLMKIALNFGLLVMIIIQTLGCVSGAHLSPVITLSACIMNQISPVLSLGYFIAQLMGCFAGYALIMCLIPKTFLPEADNVGFCLTLPHPELGYIQAVVIEFVISLAFVLFACSLWDPRNAKYGETSPLKFCFAIMGLALSAGNFTGASMNPARSLAPALWNNNFKYQVIYWIGPLSAAVVGSYCYKFVFWRDVKVD